MIKKPDIAGPLEARSYFGIALLDVWRHLQEEHRKTELCREQGRQATEPVGVRKLLGRQNAGTRDGVVAG